MEHHRNTDDACRTDYSNTEIRLKTTWAVTKLENNQIKSLPFPMPIAVGLGTAAQYPILADFVKHSELLKLPMRRFSPRSIKNLKSSDWGEQTGKIQLLAGEFVDAVYAPEYLQGGTISKILLPSLNADTSFKIDAAEDQYLQKVLSKNYLPQSKEHHYPNWMPLGFKEAAASSAEQVLKALGRVDAEKVHFFDASQFRGLL